MRFAASILRTSLKSRLSVTSGISGGAYDFEDERNHIGSSVGFHVTGYQISVWKLKWRFNNLQVVEQENRRDVTRLSWMNKPTACNLTMDYKITSDRITLLHTSYIGQSSHLLMKLDRSNAFDISCELHFLGWQRNASTFIPHSFRHLFWLGAKLQQQP